MGRTYACAPWRCRISPTKRRLSPGCFSRFAYAKKGETGPQRAQPTPKVTMNRAFGVAWVLRPLLSPTLSGHGLAVPARRHLAHLVHRSTHPALRHPRLGRTDGQRVGEPQDAATYRTLLTAPPALTIAGAIPTPRPHAVLRGAAREETLLSVAREGTNRRTPRTAVGRISGQHLERSPGFGAVVAGLVYRARIWRPCGTGLGEATAATRLGDPGPLKDGGRPADQGAYARPGVRHPPRSPRPGKVIALAPGDSRR